MERTTARAIPSARQLAVIYRPVAALKPDPRNARTHPKRQIEQLVRSIKEFGFTNPILVDEQETLIAGHGRLRAAKEMALAEVPTITLQGLNDAQKKALRLAHKLNSASDNAHYKLKPWLVEAALDRLGPRRLSLEEQRIVVDATRTPEKVNWPAWWTARPYR